MSAACVSTEYPADVQLATVNTGPQPVAVPGDANGDGKVDFADFTVMSNHYGNVTAKGAADGDFTGDGRVDFADFTVLSNNYSGGVKPAAPGVLLQISRPAGGTDSLTVTDKPGTPIELAFTTDADTVVMTTPGNNPQPLQLKADKSYSGWISAIGTTPRTYTYTATRAADGAKAIKTITLAPSADPGPAPAPDLLMTIDVYKDGTVKKR
jgi:hypothetical protein